MATATEQPKAPAAQDHPYPPGVVPYPQPYSPPFPPPPGYPPFFAYPPPPDGAHPENGQQPVPPHPYMMAFAPGMVYAYPPPPGTAFSPPAASVPPALGKPKRKQVKMACTNCAAACKRCDESRPCERCVKYGMSGTCVDGQRKERKKGIKRGPYKRKNKSDGPGTYPPGQPPTPSTAPSAPIPVPHQFPPEGFYPVYYGPPGPFLPHPGAATDATQQPTNPDGTPAQPPPLPGHPSPVGVNGQPPAILPPYFYPYPPFTHYPAIPFPPPPGMAPPPHPAPPGEATSVATGGAAAPASSASGSAPAITGADAMKKDGEAPNQDQDTPPPASTASTSSVGPMIEPSQQRPPATPAPVSGASSVVAAINAAAASATATAPATGNKKRTRAAKVNGTNGEIKLKRVKRSAITAMTITAPPPPPVTVVAKDGGVRPEDIEGRHGHGSPLGRVENSRSGEKDADAEGEVVDELNENGSGNESSG